MQEPEIIKQNNRNNSIHCNNKGARAKRALPFIVSVPAVVSVVLFDQNLDQKVTPAGLGWPGLAWAGLGQTLGWPRSSPGLGRVKPWAGLWSSPGKIGPENWRPIPGHFLAIFRSWPGMADHCRPWPAMANRGRAWPLDGSQRSQSTQVRFRVDPGMLKHPRVQVFGSRFSV